MKNKNGFMLLEAVLTIVIVSIVLTFIVESLWTNYRTGLRFQETVRALLAMENQLGLLWASSGAPDQLESAARPMDKPYELMTTSAQTSRVNAHLKKVDLTLQWPAGSGANRMAVSSILYSLDEN